jgi:hypothetical protein
VAGVFIPGVGIATDIAGSKVEAHVHAMQLQQSGCVSLDFLHDAGYDIDQAPMAWWLLGSKSPKPIEQITMPPRATTLYMALGITWRPATEPATRSSGPEGFHLQPLTKPCLRLSPHTAFHSG